MRTVAVIQARMGSTRLPGKVLAEAAGKPLLVHMIQRLARCETLDEIVVATTRLPEDDAIRLTASAYGALVFRGPEQDVLERVLGAACYYQADTIVELTADCPLIDPEIVDRAVHTFDFGQRIQPKVAFVSTSRPSLNPRNLKLAYPPGMDVRVFSRDDLERVSALTTDPVDREHVSIYFWEHQRQFWCHDMLAPKKLRDDVRLCVDTPEDLELVRAIFEELYPADKKFGLGHILKLLQVAPELRQINAHVQQKVAR